jgi:lysine-specific demethylase 8
MSEHRVKRKAADEQALPDHLLRLATTITMALRAEIQDDPIQECGPACLVVAKSKPEDVLDLAHQKLHAWPYKSVPACWRRLYEEASLWLAVKALQDQAESVSKGTAHGVNDQDPAWLARIAKTLDIAIQLTGAPGRAQTFEKTFEELSCFVSANFDTILPTHFSISAPGELETQHPISFHLGPLRFEEFQTHLDQINTPIIMKGAIKHWPARIKWISPSYWMKRTLGGRRLVPVEVGRQYTDEAWSQRIIPFGEFLSTYILNEATETGYLAQYDLFAQIPALRSDVQVPDYCYGSPPETVNESRNVAQQVDEPLMNIWFGPAGSKTPLHTDPYSNILAQVMGYKYIRLYSPRETVKLYPMGIDDKGVDMSNTSSVDVSLARLQGLVEADDLRKVQQQREKYPLFDDAEFIEGILGPGEFLYVPQGWWHYVEGLTIGASVSFWWN